MTYANSSLDPETYVDPSRIGNCPVISRVSDTLWFGGVMHGMLLPRRFEHVVSLFPTEMYAVGHRLRSLTLFPFDDGPLVPPAAILAGLARWVTACRDDAPTLVHCQAGLNRSALVVALASVLEGGSPSDVILTLRDRRDPHVLFNPTFHAWLMDNAEALRS